MNSEQIFLFENALGEDFFSKFANSFNQKNLLKKNQLINVTENSSLADLNKMFLNSSRFFLRQVMEKNNGIRQLSNLYDGSYFIKNLDADDLIFQSERKKNKILKMIWFIEEHSSVNLCFYHQNTKIPSKKGSLVIFPAFWTHVYAFENNQGIKGFYYAFSETFYQL